MRTIAVINLKGGVAKTITSNSFAYIWRSRETESSWWTTINRGTLPED